MSALLLASRYPLFIRQAGECGLSIKISHNDLPHSILSAAARLPTACLVYESRSNMIFAYLCSGASSIRMQSTATPQKRDWVGLIGDKDFFEKNDKLQRPLSYHVTIWKWELPAILSTFHRGTGAAMAMVWSGTGIVLGGAAATGLFSVHDAVEFVRVRYEHLLQVQTWTEQLHLYPSEFTPDNNQSFPCRPGTSLPR